MQTAQPEISVWDRGELDDVRQILSELGVEFGHSRTKEEDSLPTHLLISSGSRSADALSRIKRGDRTHHFLHLIVLEQASRSLAAALQREGCDLVTQAPIHPTALRLLVQRALYSGKNKRLVPRMAIGALIKLKAGLFSRSATLAELSVRGCGLVTSLQLEKGERVTLMIPATLTGNGPAKLEGTVLGIQRKVETDNGRNFVAVLFRDQTRERAVAVNNIMQRKAVGPTGLLSVRPGTPLASAPSPVAEAETPELIGAERRAGPRGRYEQPLLARGDGTIHSLIGRDLSTSGMRVVQHDGLCIGTRLRLAIYGQRGVEPVVVSAEVVRVDDRSGIGLAFDPLERTALARLQDIVDSLPELDESDKPGTLVSEILESL